NTYFINTIKTLYRKMDYVVLKIKGIHFFIFLIVLFLSKYIYNLSIDTSILLTSFIPNELEEIKIVQFGILLVPIVCFSYILHCFFRNISARIFRYGFVTLHIFVELFIIENEVISFANYLYFFIFVETLLYLLKDEKQNKMLERKTENV
ncbi:MAG: hypothetical protein PF513_02035, partial [Tenericutes bacterium]|nr:hypothetical protein [Mycoplasmatota bacterium]